MQGAYCGGHSHNKIVEAIGFDLRQASERTDARQGCGEIGAQGGREAEKTATLPKSPFHSMPAWKSEVLTWC